MISENGACYCEGPWHGRLDERPVSVLDRGHIPGGMGCLSARRPTRVPEWIARKNRGQLRAKELVR